MRNIFYRLAAEYCDAKCRTKRDCLCSRNTMKNGQSGKHCNFKFDNSKRFSCRKSFIYWDRKCGLCTLIKITSHATSKRNVVPERWICWWNQIYCDRIFILGIVLGSCVSHVKHTYINYQVFIIYFSGFETCKVFRMVIWFLLFAPLRSANRRRWLAVTEF